MKAQVISFHCVLKTKLGRVISSTTAHGVLTMPGGTSGRSGEQPMLEGLAEGLQGMKDGEKRRIDVRAERAYGFYDPDKVMVTTTDCLSGHAVTLGAKFRLKFRGEPAVFRVTEISGDQVTLDGNHPLAGEDLVFEVEAVDVREARPEDLGLEQADHLLH